MKKLILSLITLSNICGCIAYATPVTFIDQNSWNGYYAGLNAGYWWSQSNNTSANAKVDVVNPIFPRGARAVANALAIVGTNNTDNNYSGFIGGGQVGYNSLMDNYLLGIELDFDGLTNPNATNHTYKTVNLVGFPEFYQATYTLKKKINYLGTARARLGFVYTPRLVIYGTGGLAYGNVSINEWITADESLSELIYPTAIGGNNTSKSLFGWTIGAGAEWMFLPQWSAKLEYLYYDIGKKNNSFTLQQINNLRFESESVVWGSVLVSSSTKFKTNTIHLGINYHFC